MKSSKDFDNYQLKKKNAKMYYSPKEKKRKT